MLVTRPIKQNIITKPITQVNNINPIKKVTDPQSIKAKEIPNIKDANPAGVICDGNLTEDADDDRVDEIAGGGQRKSERFNVDGDGG